MQTYARGRSSGIHRGQVHPTSLANPIIILKPFLAAALAEVDTYTEILAIYSI